MPRYFLRFAYCGASFHGWQRQPDAFSVQQRIEEALAVILRVPVAVTGAGRTDTGVHASEMYAHFDTPVPISDRRRFLHSIGHLTAPEISVFELLNVLPGAHARFDAVSRTYRYYVTHRRSPFTRSLEWFCPSELDYGAMNRAARMLVGTADFTSFSKLHTDVKNNICTISAAEWKPCVQPYAESDGTRRFFFEITANRFLRNMVRAVVGTLVEVGRGRLSEQGFADVVGARDRGAAGDSMPAHALFLHRIVYPPEIFL